MNSSALSSATNASLVLPMPLALGIVQVVQNWAALVSYAVTCSAIGSLLWGLHRGWACLRVKQISPSLRLFFCAQCGFSLLGVPYQLYRVALWRVPGTFSANNYSPNLLYWLALPELVYYGAIPSAVFLLAIERCLALKFPLSKTTNKFPLFGALFFLCVVAVNTTGHLLEWPLDMSQGNFCVRGKEPMFRRCSLSVPICETASCTTTKYRLYFQLVSRIVFSSANVVGLCSAGSSPFLAVQYESRLHSVNNMYIAFGIPLIYFVFALVLWMKTRGISGHGGSAVSINKKQLIVGNLPTICPNSKYQFLQTFVQILIISSMNLVGCTAYVYMKYFGINETLIVVVQFLWLHIHGFPPVIYLTMNKTIQTDAREMLKGALKRLGWDVMAHTGVVSVPSQPTR